MKLKIGKIVSRLRRPKLRTEFSALAKDLPDERWDKFVQELWSEIALDEADTTQEAESAKLAESLVDKLPVKTEFWEQKCVRLILEMEKMPSLGLTKLSSCVVERIASTRKEIFLRDECTVAGLSLKSKRKCLKVENKRWRHLLVASNTKRFPKCVFIVKGDLKPYRFAFLSAALSKEKGDLKAFAWLLLVLLAKKARKAARVAVEAWPEALQQLPGPLASGVGIFLGSKDNNLFKDELLRSLASPGRLGCYLLATLPGEAWLETHLRHALLPALAGEAGPLALRTVIVALLLRPGFAKKVALLQQLLRQVAGARWTLTKPVIRLARQLLPFDAFQVVKSADKHVVTIGSGAEATFQVTPTDKDAAKPVDECYTPLSLEKIFSKDFDYIMREHNIGDEIMSSFSSVLTLSAEKNVNSKALKTWPPSVGIKRKREMDSTDVVSPGCGSPLKKRQKKDHDERRKKRVCLFPLKAEPVKKSPKKETKMGKWRSVKLNNQYKPRKISYHSEAELFEQLRIVSAKLTEPVHAEVHMAAVRLNKKCTDDLILARCLLRYSLEHGLCEWTLLSLVHFLSCRGRPKLVERLASEAAVVLDSDKPRAQAVAMVLGVLCAERPALVHALLHSDAPVAPALVKVLEPLRQKPHSPF